MTNAVQRLQELGQSVWCDNLGRGMIDSGELKRLMNVGVVGVTSNPTIFMNAIAGGHEYDHFLEQASAQHDETLEIYERLVLPDIGDAADMLRPVYDRTAGLDGYVSLEVNPRLAYDTQATVAEARRLWRWLHRPNVFIKVPATDQGIPAVETLIGEGISVNVTLIFSIAMYDKVMAAYLNGLKRLDVGGGDVRRVASVASFFISRVDSLVDKLLEEKRASGTRAQHLLGRAAVANAKLAYVRFKEVFAGSEIYRDLARRGARVQRPLWASTSTKNPAYPPTKYVDELVAPDSVNTMPPQTIEATLERRPDSIRVTIHDDLAAAEELFTGLAALGIEMPVVTDRLRVEGVSAFVKSFDDLLSNLENKRSMTRATL